MLEWISTPYGELVPKYNGVLLASKVDPLKEARGWVSHHKSDLASAPCQIILGVGSGHHVMEAARQFPQNRFIAIEYVKPLSVSQLYAELSTFPNVELIVGEDEKKILKNASVQRALGDLFVILSHFNSYQIASAYYEKLRSLLTARDWPSFNQVLNFRSHEEGELNGLNFTPKPGRSISVRDVVELISNKDSELTEADTIWMALGELIK